MAQIRNRIDIRNSIEEEQMRTYRKLPKFFDDIDEIKPVYGLSMSLLAHFIFIILFMVLAALQNVIFPHLPKPKMPEQDIEFKLVQNESKPPINKKTKIRSDRDSRAGGKHDPKKAISMPSPTLKKQQNKSTASAVKKQEPKKQSVENIIKKMTKKEPIAQKTNVTKQITQQKQPAPVVKNPAPVKAPGAVVPNVKPAVKPNVAPAVAPKIASAPKSPFQISVPPSKAPVGNTYKPQTSGNNSASASGGSGSSGSNLAPKFSSSGGSSNGSKTGSSNGTSYASRGSGASSGGGNYGNPSPGNPNGAPGIDAIRQPDWGPYMRDLEQRVKRNWSPPKGDSSKRVVIAFAIGRDGRLLSHHVIKSSGVPLADRAAMSAIELTAPFRPLPPEYKQQSVSIEFTFDYNVLSGIKK